MRRPAGLVMWSPFSSAALLEVMIIRPASWHQPAAARNGIDTPFSATPSREKRGKLDDGTPQELLCSGVGHRLAPDASIPSAWCVLKSFWRVKRVSASAIAILPIESHKVDSDLGCRPPAVSPCLARRMPFYAAWLPDIDPEEILDFRGLIVTEGISHTQPLSSVVRGMECVLY